MRRKVRGLRAIEKDVLAARPKERATVGRKAATPTRSGAPKDTDVTTEPDSAGKVALDYCTAVRGILNDDQGGPLSPPGLRMAKALTDVRSSLRRSAEAKTGGPRPSRSSGSSRASSGASRPSKNSRRNSAAK